MSIRNEPPQPPDEAEIERLMGEFRPRPGPRFYDRMESAPWFQQAQRHRGPAPLRFVSIFGLVLLLVLTTTLSIPSLRAMGEQIVHFFMPEPADRMNLQVTVPGPSVADGFGSPKDYSLTFDEAQRLVGFPLGQLTLIPPEVAFSGAYYDQELNSVSIRYSAENFVLLLTQRKRSKNIQEYSSIGANAPVETVPVRGVQGEYVRGGWRMKPEASQALNTAAPGSQVSLGVYWDPELPQTTLRWMEDDRMYELRFSGAKFLEKDRLIQIANSIQ